MSFNLSDSDLKFIETAEDVKLSISKMNLKLTDFTSLTYKTAIQYLISKHHFQNQAISFKRTFDLAGAKQIINTLLSVKKDSYLEIFEYTLANKFGQGEVVLYFLINDAILSGPSKNYDVTSSGKNIEVKAVKPIDYVSGNTRMKMVTDFRLGGTINFADEISKMEELYLKAITPENQKINGMFNKKPANYKTGMGNVVFEYIKKSFPKEYSAIEQSYRKKAHSYFTDKTVVFFNNQSTDSNYGSIINSKNVEESDIFMFRFIGQGMTISPSIRV